MSERGPAVRAPASSANLGSGFDVFGMALDVYADVGSGAPPPGAQALDASHPAVAPYTDLGGTGPLWLRSSIPMARGLGFSGAVRVAAAALGAVVAGRSIEQSRDDILRVATALEGHGDNAAASLFGGIVANIDHRIVSLRVGPVLSDARVVAWVPDVTTSTDRSRRSLPREVPREAAVHNLGRAVQLALAVERDDPELLRGATADELHQAARIPLVPGAEEALRVGVEAGAWCSWLSGSGPTVALLCDSDHVAAVSRSLPPGGHVKLLSIDTTGARVVPLGEE
jgi:homoserine kinase